VDRCAGEHADPQGAAQRALVAQRLASLFDFGESGLDPGEVVGARVGWPDRARRPLEQLGADFAFERGDQARGDGCDSLRSLPACEKLPVWASRTKSFSAKSR
jgi:hypothetical protein